MIEVLKMMISAEAGVADLALVAVAAEEEAEAMAWVTGHSQSYRTKHRKILKGCLRCFVCSVVAAIMPIIRY
jgi:hypothetical protein